MGEIAEMMIDGTLCEGCGVYLGDGQGFPRYCGSCAGNSFSSTYEREMKASNGQRRPKVACRICGKMVKKGQGIKDHLKVVHG